MCCQPDHIFSLITSKCDIHGLKYLRGHVFTKAAPPFRRDFLSSARRASMRNHGSKSEVDP